MGGVGSRPAGSGSDPRFDAGHGDETHGEQMAGFEAGAVFLNPDQVLPVAGIADRNDHSAALAELIDEGGGNPVWGARDDDGVVGSGFRPAQEAIGAMDGDVANAEAAQGGAGGSGELRDDFDGVDLVDEPSEHGGLVTGAGSDFEHAVGGPWVERLGHEGDDEGLGDGLMEPDGQGVIGVRLGEEVRRDEFMAWDGGHGAEHEGMCDAAVGGLQLLANHLVALGGPVGVRAGEGRGILGFRWHGMWGGRGSQPGREPMPSAGGHGRNLGGFSRGARAGCWGGDGLGGDGGGCTRSLRCGRRLLHIGA